MVELTFAVAGKKFQLEAADDETIRLVKQRLEPLCAVPAGQQKWLVKGKEAPDEQTVGALGAAKVMVLRNQAGHKASGSGTKGGSFSSLMPLTAAAAVRAASEAAAAAALAPAAPPPPPPQEPTELGQGSTLLLVSNGRQQYRVHCEATDTILSVKELLAAACSAAPRQQRLLAKGKEADDASTIAGLGFAAGGKLMLLFRAARHLQVEGDATLGACAPVIADLAKRIATTEARKKRRSDEPMVVLAAVGALEEELRAVRLDVQNAKLSDPGAREAPLGEIEALARRLELLREQLKGSS